MTKNTCTEKMVAQTRLRSKNRILGSPDERKEPAAASVLTAAQSLANLGPRQPAEPDGNFNIRRVKSLGAGLERDGGDPAEGMVTGNGNVVGDGEMEAAAASIRGAAERIGGAAADLNGAAHRLSQIDLNGGAVAIPRTAVETTSTTTTSRGTHAVMAPAMTSAMAPEVTSAMAPEVAPAMAPTVTTIAETAPPTIGATPVTTSHMAPVASAGAPTVSPTTTTTQGATGFSQPPPSETPHSIIKNFFKSRTRVSNSLAVKNLEIILKTNTPTEVAFIDVGLQMGALVPRGGYENHDGMSFVAFNEFHAEAANFLLSAYGALASPIDSEGYWIFGLKAYKRVSYCAKCKKGGRCHQDHLFEVLVYDLEENGCNPVTGPESLDLTRSFDHIRLYKKNANSRFNVPTKTQLPVTMTDLKAEEAESLIASYFPSGEIWTDNHSYFHFTITGSTPSQGVITEILKSIEFLQSKDFKRAFSTIFESNEPRDILEEGKLIQSRSQSLFALSCFLFYLLDQTSSEYDKLFESRGLRPCRGLGKFRQNLIPSGFVPLFARLEVEMELKSKIVGLSDFYSQQEHRTEEVCVTDEGCFLTRHPGSLSKFVESAFFPPMSTDEGCRSLKGFYLSHVLSLFHSLEPSLLGLYFPPGELDRVVNEIRVEVVCTVVAVT